MGGSGGSAARWRRLCAPFRTPFFFNRSPSSFDYAAFFVEKAKKRNHTRHGRRLPRSCLSDFPLRPFFFYRCCRRGSVLPAALALWSFPDTTPRVWRRHTPTHLISASSYFLSVLN